MEVRHSKVLRCAALWLLGAGLGLAQAQTTTVAGATPGQFAVNESGAATYRIPIQVPPGVAGMEPKLELVYNSQGGNGLLGMGWSLSGLSAISRCPRTMTVDGVRGGVNFDMNDRYCLDAQRLVLVSGTYGTAGSEYRTELDSFSKIVASGTAGNGVAFFTVQTKAGLTMEYGNTADSRVEAQGKTSVRVWALNKISDVKGNFMTFSYVEDNANGGHYPSRIDYTGNAGASPVLAPTASVRFVPSAIARLDVLTAYQGGSVIRTSVRIGGIQAYVGTTLVKDYRVGYLAQATSADRSMVASMTQCDGVGQCLSPTELSWPSPVVGTYTQKVSAVPTNWDAGRVWSGDFNGDGRADLMSYYGGNLITFLSNGDGTYHQKVHAVPTTNWDPTKSWIGDFNGDGLTDLMSYYGGNLATFLSNGDGTYTQKLNAVPTTNWDTTKAWAGDFNGDGLTDLMSYYGGNLATFFSNGDGTYTQKLNAVPTTNWDPTKAWAGDFNGDGLTDLMSYYGGNLATFFSNGDGTYNQKLGAVPTTNWDPTKAWAGDFNGDGLTDLMSYYGGNLATFFSNGDGAYTQKLSAVPTTNWDPTKAWAGDFDVDGLTDLMSYYGGNLATFFSNGDGTYTQKLGAVPTTNWDPAKSWVGDSNGDGGTDLVSYLGGNLVTFVLDGSSKRTVTAFAPSGGATTSIGYAPLTSAAIYTKDIAPNASAYPKVDLQYPQYVVSTVASSNGLGGTVTTQYSYGGLKAEQGTGRGMLGFRWMKSKNLSNNIESYTEFNQAWPFTGSVAKSETRLAGSGNAGVLKRTTNSYAQGMGLTTGTTFVYSSQSVEESWDLGGAQYPTVTNAYQYGQSPQYGDPTQITVSNSAGAGKTTVNEYWPANAGGGNWILGRLKKATVTSTAP
jgi:hypothetical protein